MLFEYTLIIGVLALAFGMLRVAILMITRTNPISGIIICIIGVGCIFWASTLKNSPLLASDFANSIYKVVGQFN